MINRVGQLSYSAKKNKDSISLPQFKTAEKSLSKTQNNNSLTTLNDAENSNPNIKIF